MGETPDGALWIGTASGLFRLDEDKSERVAARAELTNVIDALLAAPDGDIWVGTRQYGH